jgi:hypothetical protein
MEHGPSLMERAERTLRNFQAGIRFKKCDETGFYWFGSVKGVGADGVHANLHRFWFESPLV